MLLNMQKDKFIKISYWSLLLISFLFQLIFTLNSFNQIRYEELAESIRNVWWLHNHTIYDGTSSNIGWYGTILFIYNFFGFSLNSAKFYRLIIHLISIFCLAILFKKYFGYKKAWLPLTTIIFSPTLLYFNMMQTSYGIDLQYLPIFILLIDVFNFQKKIKSYLQQFFLWGFVMIACMSYPVFIFYLPILTILYCKKLFSCPKTKKTLFFLKNLFLSLLSFVFPLLISFFYVKSVKTLFYDPLTKTGIFRGSAGIFELNLNIFWQNILSLINDLFYKGNSYYFEINNDEFSNFYPIITIIMVFLFGIFLLKNKVFRFYLILIWTTFLFTLFISGFTFDQTGHPGIRRYTPILATFYSLFIISWYYIVNKKWHLIWLKWLLILIFFLLPLHHFLIYFNNLYFLEKPSLYRELWFGFTNSPSDYLNLTLKNLEKEDLKLSCKDDKGELITCRYSEIYAASAGACYWNKLPCKNILGYDSKTKKYIPLTIRLWEDYYWEH